MRDVVIARWRWIVGAAVLLALAGSIVSWRSQEHIERLPSSRPSLFVPAMQRVQLGYTVEAAKQLAARIAATPLVPQAFPPPTGRWKLQGRGTSRWFARDLLEPQCTLGPGELCAALKSPIERCATGDAFACMAVGDFLASRPPRMMLANLLFMNACWIGDPAGCERFEHINSGSPVTCSEDPIACTWRANRHRDATLHAEACALGSAESCVLLSVSEDDLDPVRARVHLELSCQLGNPLACGELAKRLGPRCTEHCYAPDPDQRRAALAVSCGAHWDFDDSCP